MLVLLFYKNFKKFVPGMSHIGLGNNALLTAMVLKTAGVKALPIGVNDISHIQQSLTENPTTTHAVIEGTWLQAADLEKLAGQHHNVEWMVREHSQISFLQVQNNAIKLFRDYGLLADRSLNFAISANSERFSHYWEDAYDQKCLELFNLYPLDRNPCWKRQRAHDKDVLRLDSFGAGRVLKNHTTAAAAALIIGRRLGRDIEFHINVGREPNLDSNAKAIRSIVNGVPFAKLVEDQWSSWGEFRHLCASMDCGLAATFTETFCLTAADHLAAGVPVVGTDAIEWLPRSWQAASDDADSVADVGINLLLNPHSALRGYERLREYQATALAQWKQWLKINP
jgi:glycosyltransferase involved in cell wall biosynthesis